MKSAMMNALQAESRDFQTGKIDIGKKEMPPEPEDPSELLKLS